MNFWKRIWKCVLQALPRSGKICLWLLELILPISLAVRLLQYAGVIDWLAGYAAPVFRLMGLTGDSGIVFITSIFLPLYSTIAVMTTLTFTIRQATILALMCLISHSLPMECAVAHKTGSRFGEIFIFRICMSFVVALFLNWVLPANDAPFGFTAQTDAYAGMGELLLAWLYSSLRLIVTIVLIVTALMIFQRTLQEFGLMDKIARPLVPVMKFFGLPARASLLWLAGNIIGMSYGSAVMIDEVEEGRITRSEADLVNHHLGISHSLLEDTMLFVVMGINLWWILGTRLLFAWLAVWIVRGIKRINHHKQTQHAKNAATISE